VRSLYSSALILLPFFTSGLAADDLRDIYGDCQPGEPRAPAWEPHARGRLSGFDEPL